MAISSPRLPVVGSDDGTWGNVLNQFLEVSHTPDGKLKNVLEVKNVLQFGAKGDGVTDDTAAIQSVLSETTSAYVYFPGPATYLIDALTGLRVASHQTLILHPQAIVQVKPNNITHPYRAFLLDNVTNVTIHGGQIVGDRTNHIGTTGEWGFGIEMNNVQNVVIREVTIKDCWGDGMYIAKNSRQVKLERCVYDHNRRQGLSIISADKVDIVECRFYNTGGIAPQSGVDLEPNSSSETVRNIHFSRCQFENNASASVTIQGALGTVERVRFIDCESTGTDQGFRLIQCNDIQIIGGSMSNNTSIGIHLVGVTNSIISNISTNDNLGSGRGVGIFVNNTSDGIGSSNIIVSNCLTSRNLYGIYVSTHSSGVTLIGNRATQNQTTNIHIQPGAQDITQVGNVAP